MKRVASILTAIILVVSCFMSVPFVNTISASTSNSNAEYAIDFENAQGSAFYGAGDNGKANRIANADNVDIGTATDHGNVMHFSKLMIYRDDNYVTNSSSNAVKWNTIYYPTAFRLPNSDGSGTIYLEEGAQYKVTFQMKKNSAVDSDEFDKITAALVFAESYANGDLTGNVRDWVNNGQTATLTTVNLSADTDWVNYTAEITVPKSGYAAFMLYGQTWAAKCDIDVDNIKITPTVISDDDTINFEGAQGAFYGSSSDNTNRITYADNVDIGTAAGHGNVMHFSKLMVYRNVGGYNEWNTIYYPTAFRLPASNGSETLYFEKDTQYTVTFQMKKNAAVNTTDFTSITAALVFADSYGVGKDKGNIRDWVDNGQTVTLTVVDLTADSDWVTYTADITVPVSGYGAFLLYGSGNDKKAWKASCDIDVDNISITPASIAADKIDFENAQGTFYSSNSNRISYADTADIKKTDDHGNVMHLSDIKVYRNDGYYNKWNTIYYPSAFRLPTLDGEGTLYLEKDKQYTVSFQMKKNAAISDTYFSQITAALVFADSYALGNDATNIRDWVNNGQTATLAVIDLTADSDWVTYAANITVPKSGYVAFLLYGTNWKTACDIDIDNISVTEYTEDIMTSVLCHNYDSKGNDKEITVNVVDSFNEIERPFSDSAKFDGWYTDEALTNPAKGSVGETSELWIKWRTELDKTVNTYDEENVEYVTVLDEENAGREAMTDRVVNGVAVEENHFSQYGTVVTQYPELDGSGTNAANFTSTRKLTWNWPGMVRIYDSEDDNLALFTPNKNSAYKISFKYRLRENVRSGNLTFQLRGVSSTGSIQYDINNIYVSNLATFSYATSGWVTAEAVFYTGDTVTPLFLTLVCSGSSVYTETKAWVDDIKIEEIYNTPAIYFDTCGGQPKNPQTCIAGKTLPNISVPVREGYLFDGWFTDKEYTEPFSLEVMPEKNIKLYAKWVKAAGVPYKLELDFEECDYVNDGAAANASNNIHSSELTWVNDGTAAYEGSGYISLATSEYDDEYSQSLPVTSFIDSNGESYQVVKGGRYRIRFAARANAESQYVYLVTSQQVSTIGVNVNNTVEITNANTSPDFVGVSNGEWGNYELYFIPEETGKLYFMVYRGRTGSVDFDSIVIEPVGEDVATTVEYWNDNTLVKSTFGKVGSLLVDASISNKDGYTFNGWRTADGTLHTDSTFPKEDTVLYASWVEEKDLTNAKSNITNDEYIIDFEDPEKAKIFYGTANNSSEPSTGVIYVTGDKENARSGDSYLKLNKIGIWTEQWYRKIKFFDPDSLGNQLYLDPLSVYRVSFWINVESAGTSLVRVATFDSKENVTTYKTHYQHMLQDAEMIEEFGNWVRYEADVIVGSETEMLGLVISGGYLTAAIDDISVQKLWDVTVSFESNGGSEVDPIVALAYDCVVEPGYPTREGYSFMGWYADKELTEVFKFAKTPIIEDITLYAKWEKDFVPEVAYRDEVTYKDVETTIENIPEDAHLDEKIAVVNNDKIGTAAIDSEEEQSFPWWIIVVIAAAVLILAVVFVLIIILRKRRTKKA